MNQIHQNLIYDQYPVHPNWLYWLRKKFPMAEMISQAACLRIYHDAMRSNIKLVECERSKYQDLDLWQLLMLPEKTPKRLRVDELIEEKLQIFMDKIIQKYPYFESKIYAHQAIKLSLSHIKIAPPTNFALFYCYFKTWKQQDFYKPMPSFKHKQSLDKQFVNEAIIRRKPYKYADLKRLRQIKNRDVFLKFAQFFQNTHLSQNKLLTLTQQQLDEQYNYYCRIVRPRLIEKNELVPVSFDSIETYKPIFQKFSIFLASCRITIDKNKKAWQRDTEKIFTARTGSRKIVEGMEEQPTQTVYNKSQIVNGDCIILTNKTPDILKEIVKKQDYTFKNKHKFDNYAALKLAPKEEKDIYFNGVTLKKIKQEIKYEEKIDEESESQGDQSYKYPSYRKIFLNEQLNDKVFRLHTFFRHRPKLLPQYEGTQRGAEFNQLLQEYIRYQRKKNKFPPEDYVQNGKCEGQNEMKQQVNERDNQNVQNAEVQNAEVQNAEVQNAPQIIKKIQALPEFEPLNELSYETIKKMERNEFIMINQQYQQWKSQKQNKEFIKDCGIEQNAEEQQDNEMLAEKQDVSNKMQQEKQVLNEMQDERVEGKDKRSIIQKQTRMIGISKLRTWLQDNRRKNAGVQTKQYIPKIIQQKQEQLFEQNQSAKQSDSVEIKGEQTLSEKKFNKAVNLENMVHACSGKSVVFTEYKNKKMNYFCPQCQTGLGYSKMMQHLTVCPIKVHNLYEPKNSLLDQNFFGIALTAFSNRNIPFLCFGCGEKYIIKPTYHKCQKLIGVKKFLLVDIRNNLKFNPSPSLTMDEKSCSMANTSNFCLKQKYGIECNHLKLCCSFNIGLIKNRYKNAQAQESLFALSQTDLFAISIAPEVAVIEGIGGQIISNEMYECLHHIQRKRAIPILLKEKPICYLVQLQNVGHIYNYQIVDKDWNAQICLAVSFEDQDPSEYKIMAVLRLPVLSPYEKVKVRSRIEL